MGSTHNWTCTDHLFPDLSTFKLQLHPGWVHVPNSHSNTGGNQISFTAWYRIPVWDSISLALKYDRLYSLLLKIFHPCPIQVKAGHIFPFITEVPWMKNQGLFASSVERKCCSWKWAQIPSWQLAMKTPILMYFDKQSSRPDSLLPQSIGTMHTEFLRSLKRIANEKQSGNEKSHKAMWGLTEAHLRWGGGEFGRNCKVGLRGFL